MQLSPLYLCIRVSFDVARERNQRRRNQQQFNNTALHQAAWNGFSETVRLLCKHRASTSIKNKVSQLEIPYILALAKSSERLVDLIDVQVCIQAIRRTFKSTDYARADSRATSGGRLTGVQVFRFAPERRSPSRRCANERSRRHRRRRSRRRRSRQRRFEHPLVAPCGAQQWPCASDSH